MRIKTYDISVKDSIFNPQKSDYENHNTANYKKYPSRNNKTYYKVYIHLDGKDIPFVRRVKYILHKTFRNPIKIIERNRNNPYCTLIIWTWGIFNVKVEIEDLNGKIITLDHYLTYGDEINNSNINWERI